MLKLQGLFFGFSVTPLAGTLLPHSGIRSLSL
jgi:hypothetical protein